MKVTNIASGVADALRNVVFLNPLDSRCDFVEINGQWTHMVELSHAIERGHIALNGNMRRFMNIALNSEISVKEVVHADELNRVVISVPEYVDRLAVQKFANYKGLYAQLGHRFTTHLDRVHQLTVTETYPQSGGVITEHTKLIFVCDVTFMENKNGIQRLIRLVHSWSLAVEQIRFSKLFRATCKNTVYEEVAFCPWRSAHTLNCSSLVTRKDVLRTNAPLGSRREI